MLILFSCKNKENTTEMNTKKIEDNILLQVSDLPYHAPDFTKIKESDYMPAFKEAMKRQNELIKQILANEEAATFENTILELEKSGKELDQVGNVFFALTGTDTNDNLKAIQEEVTPLLSEHQDDIQLNPNLFIRIESIYKQLETSDLDDESKKLVKNYYNDFVKAGAKLAAEDKEKLKKINTELASLTTKFNQELLEANNAGALHFENEEQLSGLSEGQIKNLKNEDDDGYTLSLLNTTQQPLLQNLDNREVRQSLFEASIHRADQGKHNTSSIVEKMAKLRSEKGKLLGYNNYAEWSLQGTMVKTPEKVTEFFSALVPAATAKAQVEANEIQQMIAKNGQDFTLEAWDWNMYAEKVRKAKYDVDEEEIKAYFELKQVLEKGVFFAANKLYGITYKERMDIPVYNPDVLVYELFEENGEQLGLFYGDFYARPSKRGGAWMSNFVTQSKLYGYKPVIYNVMNITKPAEGDASLLTYDEVETMFHEFGHALHGFFANQMYPSLSGTSVARDFVEFPSQFNENWALYPEVLEHYAIHHETGDVMPASLVAKIKKASTFNQGYSLTELLAAANLDMQWHMISDPNQLESVQKFEQDALHTTKLDVVSAVPPRYKSTYFSHIWGSGYAAGYYSYLWTEMLHHDAYNWFTEHGGMNRENGQRFRDMVLSQGDTQDYETMYRNWRGKDPSIEPMEQARGLK